MFYGQVEGTDIVVLDKRMKPLFAGYARVERLWTGARWSEGPAWFAAGQYLVWSDIPNNRVLRYDDRRVTSRCSASRPTTPTAISSTSRGGWSRANIARVA